MRLPPCFKATENIVERDNATQQKRRQFIRQICSTTLIAASGISIAGFRSIEKIGTDDIPVDFIHGVASGDPLMDRVILWTRVTPKNINEDLAIIVLWQVATDPEMRDIVVSGSTVTSSEKDYTLKVDALGLHPGTVYFYRFHVAASMSQIGRTKTLPDADITQIKLAVFSCSNYPSGYFNVYADAARQMDIDAALHIGDYIYEYESTGYGCDHAKELGRVSEPANLLLVLNDYRRRYAQYRTDLDLQAVHARMPFIAVWDDHEFADDAWRDGAGDHHAGAVGPFSHRKKAAMQAYHEWIPIRLPDPDNPEKIYRSFDFGKIASLHMLDTRIIGRDQQLMLSSYYDEEECFDTAKFKADVASPSRQMLGREQMAWLEQSVVTSKAAWQILGQQVLMARMEYPTAVTMGDMNCADFFSLKQQASHAPVSITPAQQAVLSAPTLPCYMDSWDGYQNDREKVFGIMREHQKNMVVLAGDTHNAWASDLHDNRQRCVGVEFATASVSSPGLECTYPDQDPEQIAQMMERLIEPLYYAQTSKRGYMMITATKNEVRCDWRFVDTVHKREFTAHTGRSLRTVAGDGNRKIIEVA